MALQLDRATYSVPQRQDFVVRLPDMVIWYFVMWWCLWCIFYPWRFDKGTRWKCSHGMFRYHTGSCHFSFPWLGLRFKLTFLATWGPGGSCKAQMSSWGNVAHILFIRQTCESGTRQIGSWVVAPHIPLSWSWVGMLGVSKLFFHMQDIVMKNRSEFCLFKPRNVFLLS